LVVPEIIKDYLTGIYDCSVLTEFYWPPLIIIHPNALDEITGLQLEIIMAVEIKKEFLQ